MTYTAWSTTSSDCEQRLLAMAATKVPDYMRETNELHIEASQAGPGDVGDPPPSYGALRLVVHVSVLKPSTCRLRGVESVWRWHAIRSAHRARRAHRRLHSPHGQASRPPHGFRASCRRVRRRCGQLEGLSPTLHRHHDRRQPRYVFVAAYVALPNRARRRATICRSCQTPESRWAPRSDCVAFCL